MTSTAHFYDVAHILESTLGAEQRLRRVLQRTSRILPCDRIALFDVRGTLTPPFLIQPEIAHDERLALGQRITELADLLRDDAVFDRRVVQVPMSADGMAHLAVPLVGDDQVIGVLFVESAAGAYEPKHLALLSVVAGQIAAYLTLVRCQRTSGRRAAKTASAIAELERAVELRDAVIARLVHVLRSPLNAARLARIADRLDDLGRIRRGESLAPERAPVDLARICRAVIEELATSHPQSSVGFATLGDPCCQGDSGRFSQVVMELLISAIFHGEPGAPLCIAIDGRGPLVVLRVHNDGVIPPERAAATFDFTSDDAQPAEDVGLGLFIAHRIVVEHGGSMELVLSEEEGSTFVVCLPRHARPPSDP